jgi:hypothetical protein
VADSPVTDETLDDILEQIGESLKKSETSVKHGEKAVTYKTTDELRKGARLVDELRNGRRAPVVAVPRRPKL